MSAIKLVFALLFGLQQVSFADLIDEPAVKALSPDEQKEALDDFATWRNFCTTLKAETSYSLRSLEHFGAVHFNCVCSDVTVSMRSPRKLPSALSLLDKSPFAKVGNACPASVVKAVKDAATPLDYCTNNALTQGHGGNANLGALTKKTMLPTSRKKDREVLKLNEPTSYTGTLSEFKSAPGILYLGHLEKQRDKFHLVTIKDGNLYQGGKLLDTTDSIHVVSPGGPEIKMPKAIFVIDKNGNLYVSKMSIADKFHHSTFLSGDDVIDAGMIIVKQGKILYIDNESGHYRPQECHFKNGIMALKNLGYIFDDKVNYKIIK